MKNQILKITTFLVVAVLCGCNNGKSNALQKYCLEKESDPNFMVVSIPSSLMILATDMPKEFANDVLPRLKKLKVFIFKPSSKMSEEAIAKEQKTATTILKQIKYEELLKVKGKSGLLRVLCKGDIEKNLIDEILVYSKMPVKESAVGFVLVRAIADEFPLDKIPMLINYIKNIDTNNADLQFMIDI